MMIQISEVWLEPTTQLIFTRRVFATMSATRMTKKAASRNAHAYSFARWRRRCACSASVSGAIPCSSGSGWSSVMEGSVAGLGEALDEFVRMHTTERTTG